METVLQTVKAYGDMPILVENLPVIFGELFQLVAPRVPKFGKSVDEEHKWLRSVSLLDIVDFNSLQQGHKVIKKLAT
jgi:hypothetical protein